jgi:hypothetical protein
MLIATLACLVWMGVSGLSTRSVVVSAVVLVVVVGVDWQQRRRERA